MIIYIDIDDTICSMPKTANLDYSLAIPNESAIIKANSYYDAGHTIVYWTARGTASGKDWRKLTEDQFNLWGVKYHELKMGKPNYDIFIDDKNINAKDWQNNKVTIL